MTPEEAKAVPQPSWRDRPIEPGWYVNIGDDNKFRLNPGFPDATYQYWTAEDIARGCPFRCTRLFGPIPEDAR